MDTCKKWLAGLWFSLSGILFLLMFLQTILGHFGGASTEAWGWMLPNILPTLSLMIGILIADAMGKNPSTKIVSRFIFGLCFGLSLLYLAIILLMILLQPFAHEQPLALMKEGQQLWLAPLQGLVTASLGVFFLKGADNSS